MAAAQVVFRGVRQILLGDEARPDGVDDVVVHIGDGVRRLYNLPFERLRHAPAFREDVVARLRALPDRVQDLKSKV